MYFIDAAGVLGRLERTPQGGYIAPARISRAGVMEYATAMLRKQGLDLPKDQGPITRVYCPPEVLQAAADTLRTVPCPVTRDHPPQMVTTKTFAKVSRGVSLPDSVTFDGTYLNAKLALQDEEIIADVDLGSRRQVSMGYFARTRVEKGVSPDGEAYDAVRDEIVYNHAALLSRGRGGDKVCLALDSAEIPNDNEETPVKLKIKGQEVEVTQAVIDELEAELAATKVNLSKAQEAKDAAEKELKEGTSDAALDKLVTERQAKEAAEKALKEKRERAMKAFPTIITADSAEAVIDAVLKTLDADPDGVQRLSGKVGERSAPVTDKVDPKPRKSAAERSREENAKRAKEPLKG